MTAATPLSFLSRSSLLLLRAIKSFAPIVVKAPYSSFASSGRRGVSSLSNENKDSNGSVSTTSTTSMTAQERHELYMKTYESKTADDVKTAYRNWAPVYEMHIQDQGWQAPELCAQLLDTHFEAASNSKPKDDICILDIGAGTGLVGKALHDLGYTNVDAVDLSTDMLAQAALKGVYRQIQVENASDMTGIASDTYDAAICVGALNFGHIPATALREFLRVLKPRGLVAFTTRQDFYDKSCRAVQLALVEEELWELVQERPVAQAVKDMPHIHFCYRKI